MSGRVLLALATLVVAVVPIVSAEAQRRPEDWRPENRSDWEPLGAAEIGTRLERDVIEVGRREGRFRAIGFTVRGNDVRIENLRVVYGNGESDDLVVRTLLKDGTRSRPIDLPGRAATIDRLEITYRSPGPVKIEFFGEKIRDWYEGRWEELGCQRVGFLEPNDVIRVGRREGRYRAIKLRVSEASLRLKSLRIVFGDGDSQYIDVRSIIPAGAETRPIDLDGRRRVIELVRLEYLPSISLKRSSRVCVLGLESRGRDGPDWRDRPDWRDGRKDR